MTVYVINIIMFFIQVAEMIIKTENPAYQAPGPGGSIVLNATAEFCRTLGDIPTYGLSGNREEDAQELLVNLISFYPSDS